MSIFSEQEKKESDDIDHDAIAHRLKQDVVCIIKIIIYLFFSYNRLGTFHDSELFSDILLDKGIVLIAENFTLQL